MPDRAVGARSLTFLLVLLVACGAIIRIIFAAHIAFTNDENFYWYDAYALTHHFLPAGDALTKTPVAALLFALSHLVTHSWLFADRMVNVLASLLTAWPLYLLARKYSGKQAALFVAGIWLLGAGPTNLLVLGHTEALMILFTTSAFAVPAWGAGLFFGLAVATRKSALAILPVLLYWLIKTKRRTAWQALVSAIVLAFLWAVFIFKLYGVAGIEEVLGKSSFLLIRAKLAGQSVDLGGGTLRFALATITRIALPFVALALLNGIALFSKKYRQATCNAVLATAGWIWLVSTVALYMLWPMTLPDYLAELFIPVLLISIALPWRKTIVFVFAGLTLYSLTSSYTKPWTGMFTADSLELSAGYIQELVPHGEAILTGAVIAPALADYPVFDHVAHPLWYRYNALSGTTKTVFLPPFSSIRQSVEHGTVQWILLDQLTDYAYLRENPPLITEVYQHWKKVATIPNETGFRNNPLTLWHKL